MKRIFTAVAMSALPALAWCCGVCAEDKVAATYDHAVVQAATARGKEVVFCELRGLKDVGHAKALASRQPGVDASTVRASSNPGALSFVLDPKRQSAQAAVKAIQSRLRGGETIAILRVTPAPAVSP